MTTPYTIDPQSLLDAHAKTTQGTWETDRDSSFIYCDDEELANFNNLNADREEDEANAAFCALAHNAIPEIVERLKRAEDMTLRVCEAIESMRWLTGSETHGDAFEQEIIELAAEIEKARKQ